MSDEFESDILQPLPLEKWSLVQEATKEKWPSFAYYYYWVQNAIKWKKRSPDIPVEIYSPNEKYNTFIAISTYSLYIVVAFTQESSGAILRKAIVETKRIKWNEGVHFVGVHKVFIPLIISTVESLKDVHDTEIYPLSPARFFFKSAEDCTDIEIKVPSECYLKTLEKSDIPIIHSVWPHHDEERPDLSIKYLCTMVEMNEGVGLFLKEDNSLVSWAIHTDWNGLGMVQTRDQHKKKGYARVVINTLAKQLAEKGISPTLFILEGNTVSENMFQGLGWRAISRVSWVILKRKL